MIPHLDEAGRQQSTERTVLADGTVIPEIAWACPNRANASTEDLMMKCVLAAKKGVVAQFKPASGGMTIEVSWDGNGANIPVLALAAAYLGAAGDSKARAAAVGKLVRQHVGAPE